MSWFLLVKEGVQIHFYVINFNKNKVVLKEVENFSMGMIENGYDGISRNDVPPIVVPTTSGHQTQTYNQDGPTHQKPFN